MGAVVNKGLTIRSGQQQGQRYAQRLFELIREGQLDPSFLMTHRLPLEDGAFAYELFKRKQDNCVRAVFLPSNGQLPSADTQMESRIPDLIDVYQ